jgi:hypothetical protein
MPKLCLHISVSAKSILGLLLNLLGQEETRQGGGMVPLFLELYGAVCFVSFVVFLLWAAVAKLRPDLDEEEFDFIELEKLKQLISSEQSSDALPVDAPIIEDAPRSAPTRPVKQSKRPVRVRPHLLHGRKPHTI